MRTHPFKIIICFIVLSILGMAVVPRLSVDLTPNYSPPSLRVTYSLQDATPDIIEQEVTAVLENLFSQLTELDEIYSISRYNSGEISLTFDREADIAFKQFEVAAIIRGIYADLNPRLSYPQVHRAASEQEYESPLLTYRINAPFAPYQIKEVSSDLFISAIGQLGGVEDVYLYGAEPLQISIDYNLDKMQAYQVTENDIRVRLQQSFRTLFPGSVQQAGLQKFYVKLTDPLTSLNQLEELTIKQHSSRPILLKDVARVFLEESERNRIFRINGLNSIALSIYAEEGTNRLKLANRIKEEMTHLETQVPENYEVVLSFDDSEYIEKELNKIYERSLLSIGILLFFTLIIYRNWKYMVILFSGIVVNLVLSVLITWSIGLQVHLYTLAGMTISFGLIVDNAIVMLDHLHKRQNLKVFLALFAASLTTIVALLSIYLLPYEVRKNLVEFSVIISVNLVVSMVVALFYTPSVYSLYYKKHGGIKPKLPGRLLVRFTRFYNDILCFLGRYKRITCTMLVLSFGVPIFMLPKTWEGQDWYNNTIGSDFYQEQMRPMVDKAFGGSLRLFVREVFERSSYRTPQKTRLYIAGELPYGTTLPQIDQVFHQVEAYLANFQGIEAYITNLYSSQNGRIEITFEEDFENGSFPYVLKNRLIAQSIDWSGVQWNVYGVGKGFSNRTGEGVPGFRVEMTGYNYTELEKQAELLAEKLKSHPRIQKVNTNQSLSYFERSTPQYRLNLDNGVLSHRAPGLQTIYAGIRRETKPTGSSLSVSFNNEKIPIVLKEKDAEVYSSYDLINKTHYLPDGLFKLNHAGNLTLGRTNNSIHKKNRQYIRILAFDYLGSHKFGEQYLEESLEYYETVAPNGYFAEPSTWYWGEDDVEKQYSLILIVILGIYFICAILFESLKLPLYAILSAPFAFIGVFLSFSWFDFYFDQGGYASFLLLTGLVVNSTIFIINEFQQYRSKYGNVSNRMIVKSLVTKAVPIILTILSTCLGLIPFILGGQNEVFWFSFAIGTISGLTFSLLGIFLIIPSWMVIPPHKGVVSVQNHTT